MIENKISYKIIGCAFEVHKTLGPGLLESTYQKRFQYELIKAGLYTEHEKTLDLTYKGLSVDNAYRIDLIIENRIAIEIKSVEMINDIHIAQLLTYLKLGELKLGLLINFNTKDLKHGIKRLINTF